MNREVTQAQLRDAVALVKAIREAGGPDYDIAIDVHARWNTKSTIEIIRAIQGFRLFFYEEAVPPENIDAMVEVQRVVDAPLATGERIFGRHGFRELLEKQAVRIIQPDIARTGGITEFKKIAAMADTYYIPVAPHNPNGPICTVASIHACVSIPNFLILEFFEPDEAVFNEIIPGGLRGDRGSIPPIEGPGLGITISDDFLKKHAFDEKKTDEMEKRVFDTHHLPVTGLAAARCGYAVGMTRRQSLRRRPLALTLASTLALAPASALAQAPAAPPPAAAAPRAVPAWVTKSNELAKVWLEAQAKLSPEGAGQIGPGRLRRGDHGPLARLPGSGRGRRRGRARDAAHEARRRDRSAGQAGPRNHDHGRRGHARRLRHPAEVLRPLLQRRRRRLRRAALACSTIRSRRRGARRRWCA